MNNETNAVTHENYAQVDPYEKLINVFLLCLEVVQINQLYNDFRAKIEDRNRLDITVIFDRIFFDHIVINWAKICGSHNESMHICKVFNQVGYSIDSVRNDFLKAVDMSPEEYEAMHDHLIYWRNKLLAHFDFDEVYTLTHNEKFFNKIQPQCWSIAESVINAFNNAGEKQPDFECGIFDMPKNLKLKEIADILRKKLTIYPCDCSCKKWEYILHALVAPVFPDNIL